VRDFLSGALTQLTAEKLIPFRRRKTTKDSTYELTGIGVQASVIGIKPHQFSPPSEQLSYMKAGDFVARVWVGVAEPQLNVDESGGDP
jgi:hypothetical protein